MKLHLWIRSFNNEQNGFGGYAVSYYATPRYTKDIDLWISSEPVNLHRVYRALAKFGAPEHVLEDLIGLASAGIRSGLLRAGPSDERPVSCRDAEGI